MVLNRKTKYLKISQTKVATVVGQNQKNLQVKMTSACFKECLSLGSTGNRSLKGVLSAIESHLLQAMDLT
jgi:hypothetical protein